MNVPMLIGGAIGFAIGRWPGLLLGLLLGHFISRMMLGSVVNAAIGRLQAQFLDATFSVMGALCKADGRVSEQEIRVAEALFTRLRLQGEARESAKRAFNRGKSPGFDLDAEVAAFARACRGQRALLQMFLHVQLAAISADGQLHPAEHEMLRRVARGLGLSEAELLHLEAMLRGGSPSDADARGKLDDAYRVLGVDASASDADIKKAYRRLMSQHHPDKLAAKGLPESMRVIAEEKTREITGAYELIERARAAG